MYDYIETHILRDQAAEDLFFEAMEDKLKHDLHVGHEQDQNKDKHKDEVDVYIDDKDHKYYIHHH